MSENQKTFECRVCEKPVPMDTGLCPSCGFQHARKFKLKLVIILLTVFLLFGLIIYNSITSSNIDVFNAEDTILLPAPQKEFIRVLSLYKDEYQRGSNARAGEGIYADVILLRDQRRKDVQALNIEANVYNWIGEIAFIDKTKDNRIALGVNISPSITLETHSDELKDIKENTLISLGKPAVEALKSLKKGDLVVFSGNFFLSKHDVFQSNSSSLETDLARPSFLFKFRSIHKY